jgi:uncharacterized coiled-coil DUF342 family protein
MQKDQLKQQIAELSAQLAKMEQNEEEHKIKKANEQIAEILAKVDAMLTEAAKLADDAGITFHWAGPTYGMGGWYESNEWQSSNSSC